MSKLIDDMAEVASGNTLSPTRSEKSLTSSDYINSFTGKRKTPTYVPTSPEWYGEIEEKGSFLDNRSNKVNKAGTNTTPSPSPSSLPDETGMNYTISPGRVVKTRKSPRNKTKLGQDQDNSVRKNVTTSAPNGDKDDMLGTKQNRRVEWRAVQTGMDGKIAITTAPEKHTSMHLAVDSHYIMVVRYVTLKP